MQCHVTIFKFDQNSYYGRVFNVYHFAIVFFLSTVVKFCFFHVKGKNEK